MLVPAKVVYGLNFEAFSIMLSEEHSVVKKKKEYDFWGEQAKLVCNWSGPRP